MSEIAFWRWTTLGDECEIVSGSTPKTSEPVFWDGDIPWLTPADLSKWKGTYIDGGSRYLTQSGINSCSARLFPRNTVMMSSRAPIGYTAIANREMCTNQGFKSMLPSQTVYPEWLRYLLEHALPEIKTMASGTTFAEISGKKLGTLPMHLPPLDEQRRIVRALDDHLSRLDKALTDIQKGLEKIAVTKRAWVHVRLGNGIASGKTNPLGSIAETRLGKMLDSAKNVGTPTPYLRNINVQWGRIDISDLDVAPLTEVNLQELALHPGDLLVCEGGEPGRCAIWDNPGGNTGVIAFQKALHRVRPNQAHIPEYIALVLQWLAASNGLTRYITGTTIKHLPQEKLRMLPIPELSREAQIDLCNDYDKFASNLNRLEIALEDLQRKTAQMRRALLNNAFKGGLLRA